MNAGPLLLTLILLVGADDATTDDEWGDEDAATVLEGDVREQRAPAATSAHRLAPAALASAHPEDALEDVAGLTLVRSGGPLAPARLQVRGLSGPRIRAELGGLALDDPATGALDPALWPLHMMPYATLTGGATSATPGGRLQLDGDEPSDTTVRVRAGVGSLQTARLDASGNARTPDDGFLIGGAQVALTNGDFAYRPLPSSTTTAIRANNDQRLATVLLRGGGHTRLGQSDVLLFAAAREGGVPGYATAPTDALRARRTFIGARAAITHATTAATSAVATEVRFNQRTTWQRRQAPSAVTSLAWNATTTTRLYVLESLKLAAGARAGADHLLDGPGVTRVRGNAHGDARYPLLASGDLHILGGLGMEALSPATSSLSELTLLPALRLGLDARLLPGLRTSVRVAHAGRAPTLDELYAPRGVVLGNPRLAPERSTDIETTVAAVVGNVARMRFAAFAGRLEDTILYVNRNAFEIEPLNTGPLWRAGVEGTLSLQPHRLVGGEVTANALASLVEATTGPLPIAPPFGARMSARLGASDGAQLITTMRARAGAPSTIFGTLPTDGYALVDLTARLPLGRAIIVTGSLTNALNTLDAQDANLLPLPGRQIFVAVEVST